MELRFGGEGVPLEVLQWHSFESGSVKEFLTVDPIIGKMAQK